MTKQWKPLEWDDCPTCGDGMEVLTDSVKDGSAYDGDEVRCTGCGWPGNVRVEEDDSWISWHDEADCDCEHCKRLAKS